MPPDEPGPTASGAGDQGGTDIRLGDRPVLRLFADHGRIRVGLVMPVLDRVIDISVQPAAASVALEDEGWRLDLAPQAVEATARRVITEVAERSGARVPHTQQCLQRAFGGAAFPLLGGAYDIGGQPVAEIPRWAAPVLRHTTVAGGATEAFGARATRPVRRALVTALAPLPNGEVDLAGLALALMGANALDPDRLARVLGAERVPQPAAHLPDPSTLKSVRATLTRWGPVRSERVLLDAAGRPDGVRLLITTARYAQQLDGHGPPAPLPNNLADLHAAHRSLLRGAPATPATPAGPAMPTRRARIGPRALANARARAGQPPAAAPADPPADARAVNRNAVERLVEPPPIFHAPRAPQVDLPPGHRLAVPPHIRRLDGLYFGNLCFAVPATVDDLVTWSEVLRNCLHEFGPAVASGRSIILGVARNNRLSYALELTTDRRIRQFTGTANRPPPEGDRLAVVRQLESHGAIDALDPWNRRWLNGPADQTA